MSGHPGLKATRGIMQMAKMSVLWQLQLDHSNPNTDAAKCHRLMFIRNTLPACRSPASIQSNVMLRAFS